MDHAAVRRNIHRGAMFQLPMILLWGIIPGYVGGFKWDKMVNFGMKLDWASGVHLVGILIMVTSMVRIYRNPSEARLITTDLFALTRHPMYHGMFIALCATFFYADLRDPIFWSLWALFMVLILTAGRFQEKETLARWGKEAEDYYARTPRFVFEWLWFRQR